MKRSFIKVLPLVAAVLLAVSCSKDGNDDSNVAIDPVETQNFASSTESSIPESKTIPFSITVGKYSNSLSKATVEENTLTQTFEAGDVLEISGTGISGTLMLKSGDEGKSTGATFEGELSGDGVATITSATQLTATLTNATNGNEGKELSDVQIATSLAEAFQKYGYWTSTFSYGESNNVELVQNTVFLRVKPFHGETKASFNGDDYDVQSDGTIYLAVKSGTDLTSNLFSGSKTVSNENGKVVKNIDRSDVLPGVFSVSSSKQIHFSKGNLQYKVSNKEWCFAENQWDYIGNKEGNRTSSELGTRDLFGWGTWFEGGEPMLTGSDAEYSYTTTTSAIGSDWFTLSMDEWKYLIHRRSGTRYVMATVNGVNGLIIFPDGYSETVTNANDARAYCQDLSASWSTYESAGAVFLPSAGERRNGVEVVNETGSYWSSDIHDENSAMLQGFKSGNLNQGAAYTSRYRGFSVRLVRSL